VSIAFLYSPSTRRRCSSRISSAMLVLILHRLRAAYAFARPCCCRRGVTESSQTSAKTVPAFGGFIPLRTQSTDLAPALTCWGFFDFPD
jgi:hypothetical protein